jgi:hypothetical protein
MRAAVPVGATVAHKQPRNVTQEGQSTLTQPFPNKRRKQEPVALPPPPRAVPAVAPPLADPRPLYDDNFPLVVSLLMRRMVTDSALLAELAHCGKNWHVLGRESVAFRLGEGCWVEVHVGDVFVLRALQPPHRETAVWLDSVRPEGPGLLRLFGRPGQGFETTFWGTPIAGDAAPPPRLDALFFHVGDSPAVRPRPFDADAHELLGFVNALQLQLFTYDVVKFTTERLALMPLVPLQPGTGCTAAKRYVLPLVDLCCGTGGLSHGMSQALLAHAPEAYCLPAMGVDSCRNAINNAKRNVPRHNRLQRTEDVWQAHARLLEKVVPRVETASFAQRTGLLIDDTNPALAVTSSRKSRLHPACLPGSNSILCGGLPCQGFSGANPQNAAGGYADKRNNAFKLYVRFLAAMKPAFVLVEEVVGFCGSDYIRRLVSSFDWVTRLVCASCRQGTTVHRRAACAWSSSVPHTAACCRRRRARRTTSGRRAQTATRATSSPASHR